MRNHRRIFSAVAIGAMLASLGPIMGAVASHSGNTATPLGTAEYRRGAWAQWDVTFTDDEGSALARDTYRVWVWQAGGAHLARGETTLAASAGFDGGVAVLIKRCLSGDEGMVCADERLLRGPADRVAPAGEDGVFTQEPRTLSSAFQGAVSDAHGSCRVKIDWTSEYLASGGARLWSWGATGDRAASATPLISTDCWELPAETAGMDLSQTALTWDVVEAGSR